MTIGKIERGERRVDLIEFVDICEVLGLNPMSLLTAALLASRPKGRQG